MAKKSIVIKPHENSVDVAIYNGLQKTVWEALSPAEKWELIDACIATVNYLKSLKI